MVITTIAGNRSRRAKAQPHPNQRQERYPVSTRLPLSDYELVREIADQQESSVSRIVAACVRDQLDLRRRQSDPQPDGTESAWQHASNAKRLAAIHRDDTLADLRRHLGEQFRAGEITLEECIERTMKIARHVLERPDPEISDNDALAAHRAYLDLELTARGLHPADGAR